MRTRKYPMSALRLRCPSRRLPAILTIACLGTGPALLGACAHGSEVPGSPSQRVTGQSDFVSAPQLGGSGSSSFAADAGASLAANGGAATAPTAAATGTSSSTSTTRTVEETDLYAVEGTRLYYLNSYRGLMVFDITNPSAPTLIGRSPIFGDPQEMTVQNGIAVVVVGDWYGQNVDGSPFHGSIARGLDATDPTNIKVVGEARLG